MTLRCSEAEAPDAQGIIGLSAKSYGIAMSDIHDFLEARLATGARTDPWAFAGRVEEIAYILRLSTSLPPEGKRSQTVLVQGGPGSGKTSLMSHVAHLLGRGADASTGTCIIDSPPRQWESVNEVYGHVATMLAGAPPHVGATTTQDTSKLKASIVGVGGERSRTQTAPPVAFPSASSIAAWNRANGATDWHPKRRVVVFADEVQGVKPDTPASALLEDLHAQTSIPVLLVCAGLSNSEMRLAKADLSRIDNVVTLGALSHEEAIECVERSLRQAIEHGLHGSDADIAHWAERIAGAADGWPRHLHTYLLETWRVLEGMAVPALLGGELERAVAEGDDAREAYYRRRIEISGCPPRVLRALHDGMVAQGSISEQDARGTARRALRSGTEDERADWNERFPTLDDGFDSMLGAGMLSRDGDGRYYSPIPSLTGHILTSDPGGPSGTGGSPPPPGAPPAKAPSPS